MGNSEILVSVGIPVRNGGDIFRYALETVLRQTHQNLEILISDNASTDTTPQLCLDAAGRDPRIQYFRQESLIPALDNFRFVFERARGRYFMWAAHDDLRSANYIEVLLRGFARHPNAAIIFTDSLLFDDQPLSLELNHRADAIDFLHTRQLPRQEERFRLGNTGVRSPFETHGMLFFEKHARQAKSASLEIYGLINRSYLLRYPWLDIAFAPDGPILHWLSCKGSFCYEKGAHFYYYVGTANLKETHLYAKKKLPPGFMIEHSLASSKAIVRALDVPAVSPRGIFLLVRSFFVVYLSRQGGIVNLVLNSVYGQLPVPAKELWRSSKRAWTGWFGKQTSVDHR